MNDRPPILVVGTGAMACLFAARLSAAGAPVTMLGSWPAGLDALRRQGVRLNQAGEPERAYPVGVASRPEDCPPAPLALVLVKAWQTERAAQALAACLQDGGVALSLQNGLGNWERLAQVLGPERAALGVTTLGAYLMSPGQVCASGDGVVTLNEHPRIAPVIHVLRAAGFQVQTLPDARGLLWGKLVINAAINPLTALLRVSNGELLEREAARQLMAVLAHETAAVAAASGIPLPYPDPVAAAEAVAQHTANNRSSMLQDVLREAPTEIDAICGAITQAGARVGVPTPANQTLWKLVKALRPA